MPEPPPVDGGTVDVPPDPAGGFADPVVVELPLGEEVCAAPPVALLVVGLPLGTAGVDVVEGTAELVEAAPP